MADETPSLDIDIKINADTSQGEAVKRVVREVGQEAEKTGQAANTMGGHGASAFGKMVTGGRAAHGAMMGLNTAMQGGAATAVGLARALNDVFLLVTSAAASSGPFVLLGLAVGVVLGVMRGLASHTKAAADALKAQEKAAEDAAKANVKLGQAWGTKELHNFNLEVKDLERSLDLAEKKMEAVAKIGRELRKNATDQKVLGIEIAEEQKKADAGRRIASIEASQLNPDEKARQIAAINRNMEDDAARNREAIRAVRFSGEAADTKIRIGEIDQEKQFNTQRAGIKEGEVTETQVTLGLRNDTLKRARAQLTEVERRKAADAKLVEQIAVDEFEMKALEMQGDGGRLTPEYGAAKAHIAVLNKDRAKLRDTNLPSEGQLVAVITQLIGEIEKLATELPKLKDEAKAAAADASGKNQLLDVEKTGLIANISMKGFTANLESKKDTIPGQANAEAEVARQMMAVTAAQSKMVGLTGDALNAQQITANRQIDLLQQIISVHKVTNRQVDVARRQISNSASLNEGN